ncbi:MAG: hypothetical protein OIF38_13320, partial [Cellvibrionaceae bacterium]|nr:hypothetical protein [Cellvibrionaceae bacterium]
KAETLEEMRLTLGFLQRTISQAQPLSHPSGDGFFFIGDNDRLEWVYPMSQAGVFGLQVMRLSMRDDDLVLQMQPFVRDAKTELDWSGAEAFVVIEQAKFEVAYKETWSSDWQQQWPLSRWGLYAVRLQLGKGEQHWPEMILRLGNIRQGRLAW